MGTKKKNAMKARIEEVHRRINSEWGKKDSLILNAKAEVEDVS
jgi:hypothetical protein